MARLLNILVCFTLVLGPLWVGSYFGEWRWPVLYAASATGLLALVLARPKKSAGRVSFYLLLSLLALLAGQGIWMYYNTSSVFIENEIIGNVHYFWQFVSLESQPYPEYAGGVDKAESWDRLSYILPCLLIVLAVRQMVASRVLSLRVLCGTIFWTGVAVATLGLVQRYTGAEGIYWSDELIFKQRALFFGPYRSPGIATSYMNLGFALGLSHLLATTRRLSKRKDAKPTHPLCICIGLIALFTGAMTAGSKAGTVFAACTLVFWFVMNWRAVLNMLRNASSLLPSGSPHERNIIIFAIVVAGIFGVLSLGGTVTERWEKSIDSKHSTLQARHVANAVQLKMIDDPDWSLLGYGPGSFYPLFPFHVTREEGKALNSKWVYAHNDHLQTLVEWGWLGTGAFILLIGGGGALVLIESLAHSSRYRKSTLFYFKGMALAMFICLLHATVDFPFQIESIAITFAAILGAAWAGGALRANE